MVGTYILKSTLWSRQTPEKHKINSTGSPSQDRRKPRQRRLSERIKVRF